MNARKKRFVWIVLATVILILMTGIGTTWAAVVEDEYIPICALYTIAQQPDHRSQLLAIDLVNRTSYPLGDAWLAEAQALAVHPDKGVLYAVTDRWGPFPGKLYSIDRVTGERTAIGPHGFKSITALSFRQSDASLWGWSDLDGLVQLDTTTGAGALTLAANKKFSGMAWSSDSLTLYTMQDRRLWAYQEGDDGFTFHAGNLPRGAAAIEVRPDGLLVGIARKDLPENSGNKEAHPLDQAWVFIYDPLTQEVISESAVPTQRHYPGFAGLAWPRGCGNPSPGGPADIIQSITLDKSQICPGEDLLVTVDVAHPENPQGVVDVAINGKYGNPQYLQFTGQPGPRLIVVTAATPEKFNDSQSTTVELLDCGPGHEYLELYVRPNPFHRFTVDFVVANGADFESQNPIYYWQFGDGTSAQTNLPYISHEFEDSLVYDQIHTVFQASLSMERSGYPTLSASQTVTLWSMYALNRMKGMLHLPVETDGVLEQYGLFWAGSYALKNPEGEPVSIDSIQMTYQVCDPDGSPFAKPAQAVALTVPAGGELNLNLFLPSSEITGAFCGVQITLSGQSQGGLPAYAIAYFSLRRNPLMTHLVTDGDMQALLDQVVALGLVADPLHISEEELYTLARQGLIVYPVQSSAVQQSPTFAQTQVPQTDACDLTICEPDPNNPNKCIDEPCMPGDAPPRPGLSCQTTGEWCTAPPYLANARKGDVLLISQCGLISGLLRQVSPPQFYSHAGIMTRDYYEVRHSTAADDRFEEHTVGFEGTDGFANYILKYAWPGVITQDIGHAFNGETFIDPFGDSYEIYGFHADPVLCEGDADLTWPLVVKPPPGTPQYVRAQLQVAADTALASTGHYRFYAYSDASIGLDPAYNAPSDSGWAAGTPGTVCSQFVWSSLVKSGLTLEGSILEESDMLVGAQSDAQTADGLYLYQDWERLDAGIWLWNKIHDKAYGIAGWFGDLLFEAANNVANQFVNCFAIDGCSTAYNDSTEWTDTVDSNAVSPDNILFWDTPDTGGVYGHNEYLVYRGGEYIGKTTWQPSAGNGTIEGRVYNQGSLVENASVSIAGLELFSDSNGYFVDTMIPAGSYDIVATKMIGGYFMSVTEPVVITAGQTTYIDLHLEPPPQYVRRVTVTGSMFLLDDEDVVSDETGTLAIYEARTLDIFDRDASISISYCVGDEVRTELRLNLHLSEADDMTVIVNWVSEHGKTMHAWLFEGTDCATDDLEAWGRWHKPGDPNSPPSVPPDTTLPFELMHLENAEFNSPDYADINITISNEQATFPTSAASISIPEQHTRASGPAYPCVRTTSSEPPEIRTQTVCSVPTEVKLFLPVVITGR